MIINYDLWWCWCQSCVMSIKKGCHFELVDTKAIVLIWSPPLYNALSYYGHDEKDDDNEKRWQWKKMAMSFPKTQEITLTIAILIPTPCHDHPPSIKGWRAWEKYTVTMTIWNMPTCAMIMLCFSVSFLLIPYMPIFRDPVLLYVILQVTRAFINS